LYDDLFNNIFNHKQNKSKILGDKNEARLKAIKKNFNFKHDALRQQRLDKIQDIELDKKLEKDNQE